MSPSMVAHHVESSCLKGADMTKKVEDEVSKERESSKSEEKAWRSGTVLAGADAHPQQGIYEFMASKTPGSTTPQKTPTKKK